MTDFVEEQKNEIEAIESIYPEELTILETEPFYVFTIHINPQDIDNIDEEEISSCTVKFSYVERYPDEAPVFEITDWENLEDDHISKITDLINETINENLGMVLVFTVVSAVQEKLHEIIEKTTKTREEETERKKKLEEEAEQKKFEGTRVTIESFLCWKRKFDAEMAELKKKNMEAVTSNKKLTGKELFMTDSSMDDSDVKFLQTEGDSVEVDESLFQDMDDLELDDNDIDLEAVD